MPALPPVAHSHSPALIRSGKGSLIMVMGLHGLFHLPDPKIRMGHAVGHPVAFFNGVLQPEIQRVHAQFFG